MIGLATLLIAWAGACWIGARINDNINSLLAATAWILAVAMVGAKLQEVLIP